TSSLGVLANATRAVNVKAFNACNDAVAQKLVGTGLVGFEEHRLLAANVCHRSRAQHQLTVSDRRAVIVQHLQRLGEVREVASRPKRSGTSVADSARGVNVKPCQV